MATGINLEVVDEAIKKYGSRKTLVVIVGIAAIAAMSIPEMLEPNMVAAIVIAKIIGIAALGCMGVICQYRLDKKPSEGESE